MKIVSIALQTPGIDELGEIGRVVGSWHHDGGALQLHPGDLGWYSLRGPAATAAALRVWSQDGTILAVALLDGADLLRFAVDPTRCRDDALAARVAADVDDPSAGVLRAGAATIEARGAAALTNHLAQNGWSDDEPWTPLHHDFSPERDVSALRTEVLEPGQTADWVAVHWSAFRGTPIPDEDRERFVQGWHLATKSPFIGDARIMALRCSEGPVVAVAAVWSAGEGRPGLIEPLAVHQDHRSRGHGTEITRAAVDALRRMGASSAIVCAEASNTAAVATYRAAGFVAHSDVADWRRPA